MSGTTSLCLQQQYHNITHDPLVGGLLYSFQAGTLNPQNAYRSAALTAGSEFANPVVLDASARVPQMFYADGLIRLIMTDKNGVAQFDYDNVPVIGSSGGSGSIDTTDTTRLYGTGDLKIRYGTGSITGFVRCNGKGIGNTGATGADEFADPTAQALFQYLWNISNGDLSLAVTPSRGASAVADWGANKSIATPDFRGRAIGGLDGMGGLARANNLSAAKWDILGQAFDGFETRTIAINQMPVHTHPVDVTSLNVSSVSGNITVTEVKGNVSVTSLTASAAKVGVSGNITVTSLPVSVSGTYGGGASVTVPDHSHTFAFAYVPPSPFQTSATSGGSFGFVQGGTTTTSNTGAITASGSSGGNFNGTGGLTAGQQGGGTFSGNMDTVSSVTGTGSGTFIGGTNTVGGTGTGTFSGTGSGTGSGTATSVGGGEAYNITQPTRLVTVYMRL